MVWTGPEKGQGCLTDKRRAVDISIVAHQNAPHFQHENALMGTGVAATCAAYTGDRKAWEVITIVR